MSGAMERDSVVIKKSDIEKWVKDLQEGYEVYAPVKGKFEYNFNKVEDGNFSLEYTRTMIPPKKFLHPQKEKIASYHRGDGFEWQLPKFEKKQVILGVHPCDMRAILTYDVVFGGDMPDPYYWNRRKNTIFVVMSCTIPDENCFCVSWTEDGPTMRSGSGYDLLMTDIGDKYLVEIGSFEGSLLVQYNYFEKATESDFSKKEESISKAKAKINNKLEDVEHLPEFLLAHMGHKEWEEQAKLCTSCGTCTMVCPTCFCYHVEDFNRWNMKDGERVRMWDSCQLIDFAEVAMGENFRKDRTARLKWRIYHKLAYWKEQFGTDGCTGCGRCMSYCIAQIDMTKSIAEIRGEKVHA